MAVGHLFSQTQPYQWNSKRRLKVQPKDIDRLVNGTGKVSGQRGVVLYGSSVLQPVIRGVGAGVSASTICVMTIIG